MADKPYTRRPHFDAGRGKPDGDADDGPKDSFGMPLHVQRDAGQQVQDWEAYHAARKDS